MNSGVSGNRAIAGARWKRAVPGAVTSAGHYSQVSDLGKVLVRWSNSADARGIGYGLPTPGTPASAWAERGVVTALGERSERLRAIGSHI
jgi:hypothetical protein